MKILRFILILFLPVFAESQVKSKKDPFPLFIQKKLIVSEQKAVDIANAFHFNEDKIKQTQNNVSLSWPDKIQLIRGLEAERQAKIRSVINQDEYNLIVAEFARSTTLKKTNYSQFEWKGPVRGGGLKKKEIKNKP